jgi:pimeloyl-ACP methyl ester carboxylesterase
VAAEAVATAPRQVDAAELHVALAGDEAAPPLVLLHGLGGSWRVWRRTIDGFARDFRVIAVDLPGFGRSGPYPGRDYPLDGVAGCVAAALDALGIERHVLVGHSLGGGVAIAYAADRAERIERLVLVSPAGLVATGAVRASWRSPALHRAGREATRLAEPLLAASRRARRLAFARLVHDPDSLAVGEALALVRGSRAGRGTPAAGIAIVNAGLRDRLERLTMPTLVVWGAHDRVLSPDDAARLAAALPDGRLAVLPGTGHLPMVEKPEALVDTVAGFALDERPCRVVRG